MATGINFDKYDDIPVDRSGDDIPDEITTFTEETIGKCLLNCCSLAGYTKPTPVQKHSIPICKAGRDLMACAQTGSGKTVGFLFPCIYALLRDGPSELALNDDGGRRGSRRRQVFPSAPTFEGSTVYQSGPISPDSSTAR